MFSFKFHTLFICAIRQLVMLYNGAILPHIEPKHGVYFQQDNTQNQLSTEVLIYHIFSINDSTVLISQLSVYLKFLRSLICIINY